MSASAARTGTTTAPPTDVYVSGTKTYGHRPWVYQVWVDGQVYDTFSSTSPLTWNQEWDVANMYRQALTDMS